MGTWSRLLAALAVLCLCVLPAHAEDEPASKAERLIAKLATVGDEGVGTSTSVSGSGFLPLAGTTEVGMQLLGQPAPKPSPSMRQLVALGAQAIPALLAHLDDKTQTQLKPVQGMMWQSRPNEFDINTRREASRPAGVNDPDPKTTRPTPYRVRVGDLCFVALGQIVNRAYQAVRYQPTGGLMINTPIDSKALRAAARRAWEGLTPRKHKAHLLEDFRLADTDSRRIGAYQRLAFFYPDAVEAPVLAHLKRPTYDGFAADTFVHETLYGLRAKADIRKAYLALLDEHGQVIGTGVRDVLFEDLFPWDDQHHANARRMLHELFEYPRDVEQEARPWRDYETFSERARVIRAMVHDKSTAIDRHVLEIFRRIKDDDYLALACMQRLAGRGWDEELLAYCVRRAKLSEYEGKALEAMRERLTK